MPTILEMIQEAEKRGLPIPDDKKQLIAEARNRGLVPPPGGAAVPMLPEPSTAQKYGAMAVRVAMPIFGGMTFGVPGAVAGGAVGEEVAQHILKGTREQPELNQWQVAFQGAINAVPFSKLPGVGAAGRKLLSATGSEAIAGIPAGVVAGAANELGSDLTGGRTPTLKELAFAGGAGGVTAGALGYVASKFRGTAEQHVQKATESLQAASAQVGQADAQVATAATPQATETAEKVASEATSRATQATTEAGKAAGIPELPSGKSELMHKGISSSLKDLTDRWIWSSYSNVLQRRGGAAKGLSDIMEAADSDSRTLAGQSWTAAKKAIQALGPAGSESHNRVRDVLDGREPVTTLQGETEAAAYKVIRGELDKVKNAARELGIEREEQGQKALLYTFNPRTGEREPFAGRAAQYFPRMLKLDARAEGTELRGRIVSYLADQMSISKEKAEMLWANTLITQYPTTDRMVSRQANLETGRVGLDLPSWAYEENMEAVLGNYFPRAFRRIAQAKHLGPNQENALSKLAVIKREDEELGAFAQRGFDRYMGFEQDQHPTLTRAVNAAMDMTSLSYLSPRSTIRHVAQTLGSGIRTSNTAMAKAFLGLRKGGYVNEEYQKAGHMLREATQQAWDYARAQSTYAAAQEELQKQTEGRVAGGLRKTAQWYTKAVGLKGLYDFNRQLSFGTGMMHADQMAGLLLKNPANKKALRELERVGLDSRRLPALRARWDNVREVSKHPDFFLDPTRAETYHATREAYFSELREAGTRVMRDVGLENDVLHSPLMFSEREGRLMLQFHLAALKQTKFLWDDVIKQAGKGNLNPLITLTAWGVAIGEIGADAREIMLGRNPGTGQALFGQPVAKPHGKGGVLARALSGHGSGWDIVNNYSAIGLSGYVGELFEQVTSGKRLEYGSYIGAGLEHITEIANAIKDSITKSGREGDVNAEPLLEHITKFDVPIVSPTVGLPLMQQFPKQPGRRPGSGAGGPVPKTRKSQWIGGKW